MLIVGLSHPVSRNTAACILNDDGLIAMAEEERFTRIKHANRIFPQQALDYCLAEAGVSLSEVDYFAVGHGKPALALMNYRLREPILGAYYVKKQYLDILENEKKLQTLYARVPKKKFVFVRHHIAHAASSFFSSGFQDAIIISLDGSGDCESGLLAIGKGNKIIPFFSISNGESWGKAYEYITEALGFQYNSQEGKTMGLAPYGNPDLKLIPFINWNRKIPTVNYRKRKAFFDGLKPREQTAPISSRHKDLAASMQFALERAAVKMAEIMYAESGIPRICMAGGTTLNCSMNGRLAELPWVDDIFVQPAAHDAGSALGAALFVYQEVVGKRLDWKMQHAYWGPQFDNDQIRAALQEFSGIESEYKTNIFRSGAEKLANGSVVGWFQGRLEIGPRALGNRSILGNPSHEHMKDVINLKVKNREPWRPFAPAILEEKMSRYFRNNLKAPYMILAFDTIPDFRHEIVSAIHIDGSARPQAVNKNTNPRFWQLIREFEKLTGIPALLNTSFNVANQPIVNTPVEAIQTFLDCGMDYLAIGDFLVKKTVLTK